MRHVAVVDVGQGYAHKDLRQDWPDPGLASQETLDLGDGLVAARITVAVDAGSQTTYVVFRQEKALSDQIAALQTQGWEVDKGLPDRVRRLPVA